MEKTYLLTTKYAQRLYFEVCEKLPIIDYHNHLSVSELKENKNYKNLYHIWLKPDPYKHRLMRIMGIEEEYITGIKSDYEKFEKWCEIFPLLIGTPVYDWSLLELDRVFGINIIPSGKSAKEIWDKANSLLSTEEFKPLEILKKFNVSYLAPCVSIVDDYTLFQGLEGISPSLRGDDIVALSKDFVEMLGEKTALKIKSLSDFKNAVSDRISRLKECGLCFTDHALDSGFFYIKDDGKNEERFDMLLGGGKLSEEDRAALSSEILRILGSVYKKHGLTMQLHIGAQRKTSDRLRNLAGAAGGYAGIGNCVNVKALTEFLNDLEQNSALPKTLLFTLNPSDNAVMSILSGSYSEDGTEALVSQGPAWWWCDHMQGIKEMLNHMTTYGVLSTFIGMTTDSRSILSFVRHEYFRRVLCMWIGEKIEAGELPDEPETWEKVVKRICYFNAKKIINK